MTPEKTPQAAAGTGCAHETLEEPAAVKSRRRALTIGLPRCNHPSERRFPFTPEGARLLIELGFRVKMEEGAATVIHYQDASYSRCGAEICSRREALECDIVVSLAPPAPSDIRMMRRGGMLLTLSNFCRVTREEVRTLLDCNILTIAIDMIEDERGNRPFADVLAELAGRAAIARASSLLADSVHGKGILLGGVAGVVPCEVTVIGSGIAGCSAARSASGAGALVRLFDHDVYRLREACRELGQGVVASALHPRVVANALRSADVVIYTDVSPRPVFGADEVAEMKRGVVVFDLSDDCGKTFPLLPAIDLAEVRPCDVAPTEPTRACYVNAGSYVPRTAAMALSNTFITMLRPLIDTEGTLNALKLQPGLQRAALTFMGKAVDSTIAAKAGVRHFDINLFLTLS